MPITVLHPQRECDVRNPSRDDEPKQAPAKGESNLLESSERYLRGQMSAVAFDRSVRQTIPDYRSALSALARTHRRTLIVRALVVLADAAQHITQRLQESRE